MNAPLAVMAQDAHLFEELPSSSSTAHGMQPVAAIEVWNANPPDPQFHRAWAPWRPPLPPAPPPPFPPAPPQHPHNADDVHDSESDDTRESPAEPPPMHRNARRVKIEAQDDAAEADAEDPNEFIGWAPAIDPVENGGENPPPSGSPRPPTKQL
jgi:hypothetical protein